MKFGCKKCRKEVKPFKGRLICCGHDEPMPVTSFGNKDFKGRLHGQQPKIGSGESHYRHGTLTFLDDGNGNIFDETQEDFDEER